MPSGKDPNWKTMIVEMHGSISAIKPTLDKVDKMCDDHEKRIEALEIAKAQSNGYRKAKERFYEKHPVKTAVGGAVSLEALLLLVLGIAGKILGVI